MRHNRSRTPPKWHELPNAVQLDPLTSYELYLCVCVYMNLQFFYRYIIPTWTIMYKCSWFCKNIAVFRRKNEYCFKPWILLFINFLLGYNYDSHWICLCGRCSWNIITQTCSIIIYNTGYADTGIQSDGWVIVILLLNISQ